jgi:hypothetical protein
MTRKQYNTKLLNFPALHRKLLHSEHLQSLGTPRLLEAYEYWGVLADNDVKLKVTYDHDHDDVILLSFVCAIVKKQQPMREAYWTLPTVPVPTVFSCGLDH